jgi:hypothetical protein
VGQKGVGTATATAGRRGRLHLCDGNCVHDGVAVLCRGDCSELLKCVRPPFVCAVVAAMVSVVLAARHG